VAPNLRRARKPRREQPPAAHLPDPIVDRADSIDPEHQALVAAARLGLVGVACAGQRRGRLGRPGRRGRLRVAALTLQGGRVTRVDVLLDRARPARLGLTAFRRPP
jgi:hypothetical protein